jgi:hypothetical protein
MQTTLPSEIPHLPVIVTYRSALAAGGSCIDMLIQRCSDCNSTHVRHVKKRAFESPPTQLTVNQAAGVAVNAAAAA